MAGGAQHIGRFVEHSTVDGVGNALNDRGGRSGSKAGWIRSKGEEHDDDGGDSHVEGVLSVQEA